MALTVKPLHKLFAARLSGVALRGDMNPGDLAEVKAALAQYGIGVVGHDRPISNEDHIAFSLLLGPVEGRSVLKVSGAPDKRRIDPHEIIDQSNMDETGEIFADDDRRLAFKRANRLWHTDISFHPNRATWSLLSAHILPPENPPTEFTDMRAVYDALPATMKTKLVGLVAEHSYWHSRVLGGGPEPTDEERASRPLAQHGLVHIHEPSGRQAIYLASHVTHIVGWEKDKSRALLDELMEFATRPEFVYRHDWTVGEVMIWDNLCTMHRATEFDDQRHRRDMRRTTCREFAA
jgi:alpha-ketoglutarate-dependent 2,4-dichlorophenoxyacetate dioxygenase